MNSINELKRNYNKWSDETILRVLEEIFQQQKMDKHCRLKWVQISKTVDKSPRQCYDLWVNIQKPDIISSKRMCSDEIFNKIMEIKNLHSIAKNSNQRVINTQMVTENQLDVQQDFIQLMQKLIDNQKQDE